MTNKSEGLMRFIKIFFGSIAILIAMISMAGLLFVRENIVTGLFIVAIVASMGIYLIYRGIKPAKKAEQKQAVNSTAMDMNMGSAVQNENRPVIEVINFYCQACGAHNALQTTQSQPSCEYCDTPMA